MSGSVLCIAHPGHELRLLQWLREARPVALILTDGSGSTKTSRLEASRELILEKGGRVGRIFGRFTDRSLYEVIRNQELGVVTQLADDLLETLVQEDADTIAGDMSEGFNTGHDLCWLLIQAAVMRLNRSRETPIKNYEVCLDRLAGPPGDRRPALTNRLGPEEIQAKRACVQARFPQLVDEMDRVVTAVRQVIPSGVSPGGGFAWRQGVKPGPFFC